MRLLITTQAVDLDDPVLGFFHRWITEFAGRCEHVDVICLREGRHELPQNVSVHSLGKEKGASRLRYVWRFYHYAWQLRRGYDAVFVHMNSEYAVMGGLLWRLLGKRLVLWRNHKLPGFSTAIGARFAHTVCYTSPTAYVARFPNAAQMPVGIDTELFKIGDDAPATGTILFLGRLDAVKRADLFCEAFRLLHARWEAHGGLHPRADIFGDPTPGKTKYADMLKTKYARIAELMFHPGVRNDRAPHLYASHVVYCNLTPSGSFDKTILEAMACGSVVVCSNDAVRGIVPENLLAGDTPESVMQALGAALGLSEPERRALAARQRAWVEREHSLTLLTERLFGILFAHG